MVKHLFLQIFEFLTEFDYYKTYQLESVLSVSSIFFNLRHTIIVKKFGSTPK